MAGVDPALLELPQVKTFLEIAEGLLTGSKKLVIKSTALPFAHPDYGDQVSYVHTFRVEDVDGRQP